MAKRDRRVSTFVNMRDLDWYVTGEVYLGSSAYYDRGIGVMLPGDDPEVTILSIEGDGHDGLMDEDDLSRHERDIIEDRLMDEAVS